MKSALRPPLVVFVFSRNRGEKSTRFAGFAKRLEKFGATKGFVHKTVALEDLIFIVDNKQNGHVLLKNGEKPFDEASLVYFKSWESMPEEASALATYLDSQGIPYIDHIVNGVGISKLPQLLKIWSIDTNVTPFAYGQNLTKKIINNYIPSDLYVVKKARDQKGRDNIIVKSSSVLENNSEGKLIQPFIINKGDYRVLTYGFKVRGALFREAQLGSHLNNTSAGATSTYIEAKDLDKNISSMAEEAARITGHEVAGVDVLPDETGNFYILEVNQGSQIVTGHHIERKMEAFGEFLHETILNRYARESNKKKLIGRHVNIDLPEIGLFKTEAKVDSGAYSSALCAREIFVENGVLSFSPYINGKKYPPIKTNDFKKATIVNSSGKAQERYVIKTKIVIMGKRLETSFTLTDRSEMKIPILLGRKLLRGHFLINVELSRKAFEKSL